MVYYNPYITGEYNPLYNPTNQVFFFIAHVMNEKSDLFDLFVIFLKQKDHFKEKIVPGEEGSKENLRLKKPI